LQRKLINFDVENFTQQMPDLEITESTFQYSRQISKHKILYNTCLHRFIPSARCQTGITS